MMEQLIYELNSPRNQSSPDRIHDIQRQIQHLQRDKSAWQLGLSFLQHNDATIRFYGALTLTVKLNADWENDISKDDDGNMKAYLLQSLVSSYLRLVAADDATFVLQKLCSTLTAFFQKSDSGWDHPVRHVLACGLHGRFILPNGLPTMSDLLSVASRSTVKVLAGVVRLATTIAEDANSHGLSAIESGHIQERMDNNCEDVFQLLSFCLAGFCERVLNLRFTQNAEDHDYMAASEDDYLKLAELSIGTSHLWSTSWKSQASKLSKSNYQLLTHHVTETVAAIMKCFDHKQLTGGVLQALTALQQSTPRLLLRADPQFPSSFAKSLSVQRCVSMLVHGDFDSDAAMLADFLEAVLEQADVTSPAYIKSGKYLDILQILQTLLQCEGTAVIEDTVCQVALEIVTQIVEGHTDWGEETDIDSFLQEYVKTACESCLTKMKFPVAEMLNSTQTWDSDDRARFQDFRYDVHDFFQSAFGILGTSLVEAIANSIITVSDLSDWVSFEAGLFCLTAFADSMSNEPETYDPLIIAVVNSRQWQTTMDSSESVPDRARQTSIRFIAESIAFLQRQPQNLVPVLNFLFSSLRLPASAGSASRAIYTLCDAQRSILTEALQTFLSILNTLSDLSSSDRNRIYGGVAAIVQALPSEEQKVKPLTEMLNKLEQLNDLTVTAPDPHSVILTQETSTLQTLAAIGKGLRAPSDSPIDLEDPGSINSSFWTSGPGATVQHKALQIYKNVMNMSDEKLDNDTVEAACDFLKSGLTEEHPSPFKFPPSIVFEQLSNLIVINSANIDAVLSTSSGLMASLKGGDIAVILSRLLIKITGICREIVSMFQQTHQLIGDNFAAASLDFLSRLLPRSGETLCMSEQSPELLSVFIETALVLMADADTLSRRSAAFFLAALIEFNKPNRTMNETAKQNVDKIIRSNSTRILGLLLRLAGGECARSEIEVISDPFKRYVQHQPMLTKSILREAVKQESNVLSEKALMATTLEQRNRFIAQMDALRGSRKTNEIIKEFWISCRGSGFAYVI